MYYDHPFKERIMIILLTDKETKLQRGAVTQPMARS